MNETTKNEYWWQNAQSKTYRGVSYRLYKKTPKSVEIKVRELVDVIINKYEFTENKPLIEVYTEGSDHFLDLWFFKQSYLSQSDFFISDSYMISRQKHKDLKKYGYRIRFVCGDSR